MLRLLLSLTLCLLTYSLVQAQNNQSTITQTGTSLSANIGQNGSGLTGTISQTAASTTANAETSGIISQTGTGHTAGISQNDGTQGNAAIVTQRGTTPGSNSATISQSNGSGGTGLRSTDPATAGSGLGNYATVSQTGSSNKADVVQDGAGTTKNFGFIEQFGTGNGSGSTGPVSITQSGSNDNRAEIRQGTAMMNVSGNGATINQKGLGDNNNRTNDAFITQLSDNNQATIAQVNNPAAGGFNLIRDNIATVTQAGTGSHSATINQSTLFTGDAIWPSPSSPNGFGVYSNTATVDQTGSNNAATISQLADVRDSRATITQSGSGQVATANQKYGTIQGIITVTQAGNDNTATANQYGSDSWFSLNNNATINQRGNNNTARIDQLATNAVNQIGGRSQNNEATIEQGSPTNTSQFSSATITQNGTTGGTATIGQNLTANGGNNLAFGDQNASVNSFLSINQEGSYNVARVQQRSQLDLSSGGNRATVMQTGNGNVLQNGVGSVADGSFALQNGNTNTMTVTQQGSSLTGAGVINNVANVGQVGTAQTVSISQTFIP